MIVASDKWRVREYCKRKGGCQVIYYVADVSDTGVLLKPFKGGRPVGLGRWHSWKAMNWDFQPSHPQRNGIPLVRRFAGRENQST